MLIEEITECLGVAVSGAISAETPRTFILHAKEACELSRSLNFGVAQQRASEPRLLAEIAATLAEASTSIRGMSGVLELDEDDAVLIFAMTKNMRDRADDIRGYARAAAAVAV